MVVLDVSLDYPIGVAVIVRGLELVFRPIAEHQTKFQICLGGGSIVAKDSTDNTLIARSLKDPQRFLCYGAIEGFEARSINGEYCVGKAISNLDDVVPDVERCHWSQEVGCCFRGCIIAE